MESQHWVLDAGRLWIETDAEGMFSPLAHDLSLEATVARGEGEGDAQGWRAQVAVVTAELRVTGVRRRGRVDPSVLSARDRAEIERKVREEVFHGTVELTVDAKGDAKSARAEIQAGSVRAVVPLRITTWDGDARARVHATGDAVLSLRALGVAPIKGPLGAFRVGDAVRVRFDAVWKTG